MKEIRIKKEKDKDEENTSEDFVLICTRGTCYEEPICFAGCKLCFVNHD